MKAVAVCSTVIASVFLAGLAARAVAADQGAVYQWVDKDGTPHYQDRPPEGTNAGQSATEMNLRYRMTDSEAMAAAAQKKAGLDSAAELRKAQQAGDKKADADDREQVKGEREKGCEQAREKLQKYETAHRLYRPGADGQRQYLSDEEIDAARAEARKSVADWCSE
ncbi:hypothetical protein GPROT2_00878 [Gammaproteobacteria bacterium]|nr:DUF4124 domain-containing protein [Gammaproteobacteria bacterium]QOJ33003.1 MAG: DUF4124 domain-containing protein [Gammaproteobacteria bacterium]CAG0940268.1 hypothetical protein GPROT2_00878 [Gammaproteobacteria bacterium]